MLKDLLKCFGNVFEKYADKRRKPPPIEYLQYQSNILKMQLKYDAKIPMKSRKEWEKDR